METKHPQADISAPRTSGRADTVHANAVRSLAASVPNIATTLVDTTHWLPLHPAIGLSGGAAAAIAAHFFSAPSIAWFAYGFFLAVGLMYWLFSSSFMVRRHLTTIRDWRDDGLITNDQYRELRERLLKWFHLRRFGKDE